MVLGFLVARERGSSLFGGRPSWASLNEGFGSSAAWLASSLLAQFFSYYPSVEPIVPSRLTRLFSPLFRPFPQRD